MAQPVIALDLRAKRFGAAEVLGPMALAVAPGEIVALTGPSGVGKSTLLRILAGLDADFDGALQAPRRLAMAFQEPTLLPWRSARDNLIRVAGVAPDAADDLLAEVGLAGRGDAWPGQLSLGEQRRLALARALAAGPELVLLDEPFASLDPPRVEEMLDLTARLLAARGAAAILVTHAPHEAARLATRALRLEGRPARLLAQPGLRNPRINEDES